MKKAILPIAAMAFLLASCDTSTKDSYQTMNYPEYNLIIDNQDASAAATASFSNYEVKYNISRNTVDVKTSDLILNNQKYSFETDTMALGHKYFNIDGTTSYLITFSKKGSTGIGSPASNLTGAFVRCFVPQTNDVLNPSFTLGVSERLDLSYTLNDRYKVQTFWPSAYYQGQNIATSSEGSYSTKGTGYLAQINFEKKTASVYVYNAEFSADKEKSLPKVIRFDEIPVEFTHYGFILKSEAPKTQVLGIKDKRTALVDSVGFQATDFSFDLTSPDLTDALISYKLAGNQVTFNGCSIIKGN
ncbi:MAG: hypothetical protein K2M16_03100 [Muribaculaceae bacterium]|nr:hypothetical protein [Muribaculaceae bacterium]